MNTRDYALAPRLRARLMGAALALIGLALAGGVFLVALLRLPADLLTGLVVLAVVGVFALGYGLVRKWYVVRLDEVGYRVRFVRGVGCARGRWSDVEDLTALTVAGARCVVLRLRDGRTTTVPVDVIEGDPEAFVDVLSAHLDRGSGYRRLG